MTIRVLLDSGSSGELLFVKKRPIKHISTVKWAVPQSWGTSNGTFDTDKMGDIDFVEYSASKKVCLQPDIVEYDLGGQAPMFDLITGKQTLHNLGVLLDFNEKTIQIDKILLPMWNIANLQFNPSIARVLRLNTCLTQKPISTHSSTKHVVEVLDAKCEKPDLPAIVRKNYSHIKTSDGEKLLSVMINFELLFDGTLGNWNLPPVSFELK
jgi:hypothetical protein